MLLHARLTIRDSAREEVNYYFRIEHHAFPLGK